MNYLYVKNEKKEYGYFQEEASERLYLKDIDVYVDLKCMQANKENFTVKSYTTGAVLVKNKAGFHQKLKASQWAYMAKVLAIILGLSFILNFENAFALTQQEKHVKMIEKSIVQKKLTQAEKYIKYYERKNRVKNPKVEKAKFKIQFYKCKQALEKRSLARAESFCANLFKPKNNIKYYPKAHRVYARALKKLYLEAYMIEDYQRYQAFLRYKAIKLMAPKKSTLYVKSNAKLMKLAKNR